MKGNLNIFKILKIKFFCPYFKVFITMFKYNPQAQPIAKEAKIVKLNKINNGSNSNYQRQLQSELDVSNISFISANDVQHLPELNSTLIYSSVNSSFQSNSFDTTKSYSDSDDNDVTGEYLTKVYIIKDHKGQLNYGDMSVKRGSMSI